MTTQLTTPSPAAEPERPPRGRLARLVLGPGKVWLYSHHYQVGVSLVRVDYCRVIPAGAMFCDFLGSHSRSMPHRC